MIMAQVLDHTLFSGLGFMISPLSKYPFLLLALNLLIFFLFMLSKPNIALRVVRESQDGSSSEPVQQPVIRHVL